MKTRIDPRSNVHDFATVCARCERPFSSLDEELAAAGVSRVEWQEIRDAWRTRLGQRGEGAPALARAFAEAFAHASSQAATSPPHARGPNGRGVPGSTTGNFGAAAPTPLQSESTQPAPQRASHLSASMVAATHVAPLAQVSIQSTAHDDEPSVDSTLPPVPRAQAAKSLPFRDGRGGPPPTVSLTLTRSRERDPDAGETLGIAGTIVPTAATPFEEAALERWTVERYAALVADRRIDPAEQARNAYGLANSAEESALLVHMNKRFGSEPGLLARWQALVAARMRERGRGCS